MNENINREDLLPVWADVNESLEIMRGFERGEIKKSDAKKIARQGSRYLTRARRTLGKIVNLSED